MRYERFRLEVRPAELTAFDRPAVLSRARDLLRAHPGIGVEDITKARSGVDISVRLATGDPADEIVSDVLRRALGLPEASGQFRRIPWPASQSGPAGPESSPRLDRSPGADGAQSPPRSPGSPSAPREPSPSLGAASGEEFASRLNYADAVRSLRAREKPVRSGPPRRRRMVGQCPDTVLVGETFSLLVRIGVSEGGAELKSFTVPAGGLDILLVLHAPGLRVLGGERQTLRVPAEGDSEPSMFELVADSPGARKISITAWQDGSYLGELQVELTAFADAPASRPQSVRAELSREIVDGAVTLVVRYDPARNAYRFQFHDIDNPREEVHALSNPPGPLVEELVNELDRLAEGRTGYSAGETRDYLQDAGARLWQQLLPQRVRDQFWERQNRIRQLTIIADGDAVPWELLYPMDPGHDAGFLVEQFPVTRDLFDRPPLVRSLRLHPARFVLPPDSPEAAGDEIAGLRHLLQAGQSPEAVLSEFTPLRRLISQGGFGLLHFACHNSFSPVGGSSISLGNQPFTVTNMQTARINRSLLSSTPVIFLNACRTAGLAATYNGLDGWAEAFMQAGAGAFVGSLWSVTDGAAREFAQEFYHQLREGLPLGEAVTKARGSAASQPGDPTWLAYTVYGDPSARLAAV
jgi:CHAT domain